MLADLSLIPELKLAQAFAGPDHLPAGSDYPHKIGSLEKMLSSIEARSVAALAESLRLSALLRWNAAPPDSRKDS